MKYYRTSVVTAIKCILDDDNFGFDAVKEFCGYQNHVNYCEQSTTRFVVVHSSTSTFAVLDGDYIVKDGYGDLSSCAPEVFEQNYKPVNPAVDTYEELMEQLEVANQFINDAFTAHPNLDRDVARVRDLA